MCVIVDKKPDGIAGIMWHTERFHQQIAYLKRLSRREQPPTDPYLAIPFRIFCYRFRREPIGINGATVCLAEHAKSPDVIGMLMRQKNPMDIRHMTTDRRQPLRDLPRAQSRVHQQPRRIGLNQRTVASAATAKNRNLYPHAHAPNPTPIQP